MSERSDSLLDTIRRQAADIGRTVRLMEVCGTHTVTIFRSGIRSLLPQNVRLISGPGCPVCVTAQSHLDAAIELAALPNVIVTTYGDMLRVPGRSGSLEKQRASGGDVRITTSAMQAVTLAERNPDCQVVFIAVGFETTAPATAAAIIEADKRRLTNLSVLIAHKLVVPAMMALLADGKCKLDGFICPGHVSVIIGSEAYRQVVRRYRIPCVVTGFEPEGILTGIAMLLGQIRDGQGRLENAYRGLVGRFGNATAQSYIDQVFEVCATSWRAMGKIPMSGLRLRPRYADFDALNRFPIPLREDHDPPGCLCGQVICGRVEPIDCPFFGDPCTPLNPIGPCMVGSEATCRAWYQYNRNDTLRSVRNRTRAMTGGGV